MMFDERRRSSGITHSREHEDPRPPIFLIADCIFSIFHSFFLSLSLISYAYRIKKFFFNDYDVDDDNDNDDNDNESFHVV